MLHRTAKPPLAEVGEAPDPRFTLANERTFLAWTRTALALVSVGLGVVEFLRSEPRIERLVLGVPLMVLGAVIAFMSYGRWEATERSMRLRRPLLYSPIFRSLAVGVAAVSVAAVVVVLARS